MPLTLDPGDVAFRTNHRTDKSAQTTMPSVACVWTSAGTDGHPATVFAPTNSVYLQAAWHMGALKQLPRYTLSIQWDLFRGFQRNLHLLPLKTAHVSMKQKKVPVALVPGTWRLVKTPKMQHLHRGWYSLVARTLLHGPTCKKGPCQSQMRQTRFYSY